MRTMDVEDLREALRAHGQRVTNQRLVLLAALRGLGHHATAEEILHAAEDRLPALSLPTVYATLDLFDRLGLVRKIATGAGPARYDPVLDQHHHFTCRRCGAVEDLPVSVDASPALRAAAAGGHVPASAEVVVSGLCRRCAG
jgi:Fe2+ or Zn2+ uptake regulation protein